MKFEVGQLVRSTDRIVGQFGHVNVGCVGIIASKVHTGESVKRITGAWMYRVTWLSNTTSGDFYLLGGVIEPIGDSK
jgi:hypothetical protein